MSQADVPNIAETTHLLWYPGHDLILADIVRAENCSLFDSRGNRYVDLESGVWCTSVGHGNPRVIRALSEQLSRIGHTGFGYASRTAEEVARKILSLLGFKNGRCVFLCSGSEAVEYGVRLAQMVSARPLLMTMTDSYFGAYGSASKREASEWYGFDWLQCADCPDSESCDRSCDNWTAIPHDRIGGFLFEPGSSSGLVRFPPRRLIQRLCRTVTQNGGLILVNEVTTGAGRTGEWFGYQHYGISPDVVALGKGIGNGYPVSVAAFSSSVIRRMGSTPLKYAQSHQNDPVGAAVVGEVVRIIEEDQLIERSREISRLLLAGLERVKRRTGRIREIRGRGLMIAVELVDDSERSLTIRAHRELANRGFLLARRPETSVFRIDPALTIDREDIEGFVRALEDILAGTVY